jgi:hypothetical protein
MQIQQARGIGVSEEASSLLVIIIIVTVTERQKTITDWNDVARWHPLE